nr:hypothetical protein CFP56_16629 [Quercus suber]
MSAIGTRGERRKWERLPDGQQGHVAKVQRLEVGHVLRLVLADVEDERADAPEQAKGQNRHGQCVPPFELRRALLDRAHRVEPVLLLPQQDQPRGLGAPASRADRGHLPQHLQRVGRGSPRGRVEGWRAGRRGAADAVELRGRGILESEGGGDDRSLAGEDGAAVFQLHRGRDRAADRAGSAALDVAPDDLLGPQLGREAGDGADHQPEHDDAEDGVRKDQAAARVAGRIQIAEADGEDGDVAVVEGVDVAPVLVLRAVVRLDAREHGAAAGEPDEEQHRLQDEGALRLRQREVLRVVAEEVAQHVDHEDHGADAVHAGRDDRVPEALRVRLLGARRRDVGLHGHGDGDQDAGRHVPRDDGDGQRDDVPDAVGEVAQQEEVADEADDQRDQVGPVAPARVVEAAALEVREQRAAAVPRAGGGVGGAVDETHAPRGDQGRDAEDVRQGPEGRREQRDRRRREPPVLLVLVVPVAQRELPPPPAVVSAVDDERRPSNGRLALGSAPREPDMRRMVRLCLHRSVKRQLVDPFLSPFHTKAECKSDQVQSERRQHTSFTSDEILHSSALSSESHHMENQNQVYLTLREWKAMCCWLHDDRSVQPQALIRKRDVEKQSREMGRGRERQPRARAERLLDH